MKKKKIKLGWIFMVLVSFTLICWDLLTSLNTAAAEEGTFRLESAFETVSYPNAKVAVVPSDYSGLSKTVSRDVDPDYSQIEIMVKKAIELQGGFDGVINKGDTVLLKPNLVEKNTPSGLGTNTDVRVIKALIKIISDFTENDVSIVVAEGCPRADNDDPASTSSSWEASGYRDLLTDPYLTGIKFKLFNLNQPYSDLVKVDLGSKGTAAPHNYSYMIHKEQLAADVYISVPVLKIHNTGMTGALKNQIGTAPGCYYGYNKMAGTTYYDGLVHDVAQRRWTTEEIVDLSIISDIDFVVVDAIMCLETKKTYTSSPNNQVRFNTIIAGVDPVAVDHVCTKLLGLNPDDIAHITLSEKVGLGTNDFSKIEVVGATIDQVKKQVKKNQEANGIFGQSNRTWILSKAFSGTDIDSSFIADEATFVPNPGENDWSQPVYFFDDRIDLLSYYNGQSNIVSYAFTKFDSPADMLAEFWLGSDEGMIIYLNGIKVYSFTSSRTYSDGTIKSEIKKINIKKGENTLLVKTLQKAGDYSFALNICEVESNTLYAGNRVDGLKFYQKAGIQSNLRQEYTKNYHNLNVYPNPVTSDATIEFEIAQNEKTNISIIDINGKLVKNISNDLYNTGKQTVRFTSENINSGTYFIVIKNSKVSYKKIIIK